MRTTLLIIAVIVIPFVWGWLADALLRRVWPQRGEEPASERRPAERQPDRQREFLDFQI